MTTTKVTREASRLQARKWFEERQSRKMKVCDESATSNESKSDVPSTKTSTRKTPSRKKESAKTNTQELPKPKRTTRSTRAAKDDDSVTSSSSQGSTSSLRKLIQRVTRPLKKNAVAKETSNNGKKKRPQRKSLSAPAPIVTSERRVTRSRKTDAAAVKEVADPSKMSTAKKSNRARQPLLKEELQTILSPALGSLQQVVSPTDSLSTTFSHLEDMSFSGIAASVAEFAVEEISILKSGKSEPLDDVHVVETESSVMAPESVDMSASCISVDENAKGVEGKVLDAEENSFRDLNLVATEEDSVDPYIAQEENLEAEASDEVTSVTKTFPIDVTLAYAAVMFAFVALLVAMSVFVQSKNTQGELAAMLDGDSIEEYVRHITEKMNDASRFVGQNSKELQEVLKDSWGRDVSMAAIGGVYSLSFYKSPKATFAASVLAMGAVVFVMK
ncbi:hypothetical protein FisN_16Hh233 [Fistulifera solaris]|uniref:Uncharacterized protein n=1 Tax=Fistulifera solaris TaxID=1519565 RepID=A0A1Z5KSP4_FISSO|nr:hypothetical protein FisN_16Hh233 [Fistulifera solaris]|eukprot:GAX29333.1 hypothetical protein FisN_16Hh233 [Fistulifera solaris]